MSTKGDEFLLRARESFRLTRQPESLRKIDVPEVGGAIYYYPKMSVYERRAVFSKLPLSSGRTVADVEAAFFAAVLYRARDEFGNLLFGESAEAALEDMDPAVIRRIGAEMNSEPEPTVEDAEKN